MPAIVARPAGSRRPARRRPSTSTRRAAGRRWPDRAGQPRPRLRLELAAEMGAASRTETRVDPDFGQTPISATSGRGRRLGLANRRSDRRNKGPDPDDQRPLDGLAFGGEPIGLLGPEGLGP